MPPKIVEKNVRKKVVHEVRTEMKNRTFSGNNNCVYINLYLRYSDYFGFEISGQGR